jgi:glycosyltransferase involved in cell wall biosynthesis
MHIFLYLKHFPATGDWLHEGTTKAVHGLASGIVACGAQATVLCEADQTSQVQAAAGYTIACFRQASQRGSSAPSLRLAPELQTFLREQATQPGGLVILNGIFHRSVYALSRLLAKTGIPYIVAPHDPYHPSIFQTNRYLKLAYWHLLEKPMLQRACAVQLLDPRHQEWLVRRGIQTPTVAVPNGFEPCDVIAETAIQWPYPDDHAPSNPLPPPPHLFFLGRIDRYNKGLDILIDALAQIRATTPIKLTIQGPDWGDRRQLAAQAQALNLAEAVCFMEPDYARSPANLAAQHEVFCLPSRFEGFGLVAIEAMLAGRVLLVSEVAGIAPYVQASGCGVVVAPTVAGVAEGIEHLLAVRSQWPEMGRRGRQYVLDHLQWQGIAAQALVAYSQMLAVSSSQLALSPG